MRRCAALCLVFGVAWGLAGCGQADVTTEPVEQAYGGPLYLARSDAEHPRAGAAGDVVACDVWGDGGFSGAKVYGGGATAGSPEEALEVAQNEGGFLDWAHEGLRIGKRDAHRVLFVLEVDRVVKQAVIVRDGPATEGAGGAGWYVESWARCDYSELPRSVADSLGLQVWSDSHGRLAPTTKIQSWIGSEHCDWQSMTFLYLGKAVYVRDPQPDLVEYFAEPYAEHAELPPDAIDTGFERGHEHLWVSSDEQRAFVGTDEDVEIWPRTTQPLGCA